MSLSDNIEAIHGKQGKIWMENLSSTVATLNIQLGLSQLEECTNLSYNYVLSGWQNSAPVVLKLSLDQDSLKKEANALRAFQNYSAIKVLAEGDGFLLLQRAIPGQSLRILFPDLDSKALKITANLIGQLHRAAYSSDDFTHLRDWLEPLRCTWDIPEGFLSLANSLATDLLHSSKSQVLLHADLHHDNILQNGAEWVVIDPKGVIGDPVYEVAAFIRNPIDCLINTADLESILLERSTAFAKLLNFERTRILQWSFVQAVLSWVWAIEDDTDITYFEKLTHTLDRVLQKD